MAFVRMTSRLAAWHVCSSISAQAQRCEEGPQAASQRIPSGCLAAYGKERLAEGAAVNPHALSRWDRRQRLRPVDHKKAANFLSLLFSDLAGGGAHSRMCGGAHSRMCTPAHWNADYWKLNSNNLLAIMCTGTHLTSNYWKGKF
jgi:hypothetical protein